MRSTMLAILALVTAVSATTRIQAEMPGSCSIEQSHNGEGRDETRLSFQWKGRECESGRHCGSGNSDMLWNKWSGITPEDLQHEGAHIDARMKAESGEMRCVGVIHAGALDGQYSFTPDEQFRKRMEAMGFNDQTTDNLQGYAMLDVTTGWVKGMQDAGVKGMTAQKLMGLRALRVDPPYVQAMAAAGYPELQADKLTGMKAVGVSPEKVEAVCKMGYSPTEEELIQLSVFKIDAPFVERMKSRGFKNLTIAQLVQIKVFKLDE
jgi:hypothetical protein